MIQGGLIVGFDIINDYRPLSLDGVKGQDTTVRILEEYLEEGSLPHTILFTGNSGVGKTTMARILASELVDGKTARLDLIQVDAASAAGKGAEAIRGIVDSTRYTTFGQARVYIIDEVHAFSVQAFQVLLKTLEEPGDKNYFFLCTTEFGKIPKTVISRCHHFKLLDAKDDDVFDLISEVNDEAKLEVGKKVLDLISEGEISFRLALVKLNLCRGLGNSDLEEAGKILDTTVSDTQAIDFVRKLYKGNLSLTEYFYLIGDLQKNNVAAESVRLLAVNYGNTILLKSKGNFSGWEREVFRGMLEVDTKNTAEKLSQILLLVIDLIEDV